MSEPDPAFSGFVPVDGKTVQAVEDAAASIVRARSELERATEELLELAEDMKREAVRRLTERGASSAQVERYEAAYQRAAQATRAASAALEGSCAAMIDAVRALRG